jgi:FixJ family two-component response regulator
VAVIEDDSAMLAGLKRMLNAVGYASETFASAEEFLARPVLPDIMCLVVDINLGGMSGIEMGRRLKASGRHIPVIFITARDDEATHRAAVSVGYAAYLCKPFVGQALVDAITQATHVSCHVTND